MREFMQVFLSPVVLTNFGEELKAGFPTTRAILEAVAWRKYCMCVQLIAPGETRSGKYILDLTFAEGNICFIYDILV